MGIPVYYNLGTMLESLTPARKLEIGNNMLTAMTSRSLRTSDIAKELGVHVNTVRLYERYGFLPEIRRGRNGYRQYTARHLEQARLVHLTLRWPYVGDKALLLELV